MDQFLQTQYANMKDWLQQAESKNMILSRACSIWGIVFVVAAITFEDSFTKLLIMVGLLIPLSLGLIASWLSLFPHWRVVKTLERVSQQISQSYRELSRPEKGLIHFGDLVGLNSKEYLAKIGEKGGYSTEKGFNALDEEFAQQILTLAQITHRKFAMFKLGLTLLLISVPLLSTVFSIFYFLIKNG